MEGEKKREERRGEREKRKWRRGQKMKDRIYLCQIAWAVGSVFFF